MTSKFIGGVLHLNSTTSNLQFTPAVTALNNGGFFLSYTDFNSPGTVVQDIRGLVVGVWRKCDPDMSARADDMVTKLRDAITKLERDLEKARAAGNDKKVKDLEGDLESRRAFLEMAEKTAAEFG